MQNSNKQENNELILIPKAERYIQYIIELIMKLPRIEKFGIGTEYKQSMFKMLEKILVEPKNAIVKQFRKMLSFENVELEITDEAIKAIAEEAYKRKTGARALRSIMEDFMIDVMYEVPSMENVKKCIITEEVIKEHKKPTIEFNSEK